MPQLIPPSVTIFFLASGIVLFLLGIFFKGFFTFPRYRRHRWSCLLVLAVGALIVFLTFGTTGAWRDPLMRVEGEVITPYVSLGTFLQGWIPSHALTIKWMAVIIALLLTPLAFLVKKKAAFPLVLWIYAIGLATAGGVFLSRRLLLPAVVLLSLASLYFFAFTFFRGFVKGPFPPEPLRGMRGQILLAALILLAFLLRTYLLGDVSYRFDNFECDYPPAAFRLLEAGQHPTNYWLGTGCRGSGHGNLSPIYVYCVALSFRLYGVSMASLKLVSVACGIFALIFAYGIIRTLFNKNLAMITTFFLAISPLHINYSRVALLYSASLSISLLILYLVLRAVLQRDLRCYALWGIVLIFASYVYFVAEFPMLLSLLLLAIFIVFKRGFLIRHWPGIVLVLAMLLLVTIALNLPTVELLKPGVFYYESVWHRTQGHQYTREADYVRAIPLIWENMRLLVRSFFLDRNFNYNPFPRGNLYFNPIVTALVPLGIAFSIANIKRANYRLLLFFAAAFLVPNLLSRPPVMVRRMMISWPFLLCLAAIPVWQFFEISRRIFGKTSGRVLSLFAVAGLLLIGAWDTSVFFTSNQSAGRWDQERHFDEYAKRIGQGRFLYIVPQGHLSRQTIDFILYDEEVPAHRRYRYIAPGELARISREEIISQSPVAFVCSSNLVNRRMMDKLQARLGRGRVEEYRDRFGMHTAYALIVEKGPQEEEAAPEKR